MSTFTVNWVRFTKIFLFVFALGFAAWLGKQLFDKTESTPAPTSLTSTQSNTLNEIPEDRNSSAALLICIGELDNREWSLVLSDTANKHITMVHIIDASSDADLSRSIPVAQARERVITSVKSRADFARVMYIASKLASRLQPSTVLFIGSPSSFNPLTKNVDVPAIATDETMADLVGTDRSIRVYHSRPTKRDDVMFALVDELKNRSTTVNEVFF